MAYYHNPNNPVARASMDHWHKIAAMMMHKLGLKSLAITAADIDKMNAAGPFDIGISDEKGHIEVLLLTEAESRALVKKHGGTPSQS